MFRDLAKYISWKYGSYDGIAEYRRFEIGGLKMFFQQFRIWGIDISWTLVYLGASFIDYEYRIKRDEIWEYACDLEKDISNNPLLSRLLIADETEEFYSIVQKLSESEKINLEFEKRKWIVYVLYQAVYARFPKILRLRICLHYLICGDIWDVPNIIHGIPRKMIM